MQHNTSRSIGIQYGKIQHTAKQQMILRDIKQCIHTQGADDNGRTRSDKAVITKWKPRRFPFHLCRRRNHKRRRPGVGWGGWWWVRGDHPRRRIERRELMKTPPRSPSVEPRDFVIAGWDWVRGTANWEELQRGKQDAKRGRGKDSDERKGGRRGRQWNICTDVEESDRRIDGSR